MALKFNPFTGELDYTDREVFALSSPPADKPDGFVGLVDGILYYFAGGNRYKIVAAVDNPSSAYDSALYGVGTYS